MLMENAIDILQVIFADIILSGDNALIIGMAAAGLSEKYRKKAIFMGMALAAILRILFALLASFMLQIQGILFIGGLLLGFVCWRFFKELIKQNHEEFESSTDKPIVNCLLYTSPSPRDGLLSRMPSSA